MTVPPTLPFIPHPETPEHRVALSRHISTATGLDDGRQWLRSRRSAGVDVLNKDRDTRRV